MNRQRNARSAICGIISLVLLMGAGSTVEGADYPFADDFESGLGNWTADAPWGDTTAFYASPAHSATDSPSTFYASSVDTSLSLASSIDLTAATAPVLRFKHRYQLEDGHDFGFVETSTDGGVSWSTPVATYTGGVGSWVRDQIDLSALAGYNDVRIRFRIVTDSTVNQDGWYIDDVLITEAPASVALATPVTVTPNSVELSWSASAEPAFAAYRIYRSTSAGFDWRTATLVTEITDVTTTTHTDITVVPKTTYHYMVMVVTSNELHSLSNEETAATPAGMDYPFLDDGEAGPSAWTPDPPWALTTEAAFSGSHSWSDSPGGDYGASIPSQSLTLVGPIDLTSSSAPVLSFVHTWDFLSGDSGNVEISTDGGSSWTPLAVYTAGGSGGWLRERFELDPYSFSNNVFVRFRITTSAADGADGWHVDDISVAESPTEVDPPILDLITSHSIRLTWARCNDLLFSRYAIFRSTATGVGINSTLVTEIHDQDTTTFTDTGLAVDTDYFYRVYAVSPYGAYSPDSPAESTARTGANAYPFIEDFEGSLENWTLTGDWAATDTDQNGGTYSLTDSPSTTYPNSSTTVAWTSIDLTGSSWPVLRFWDRYSFFNASDWGYLEVSINGSTWNRVYATTNSRSTWAEQSVDLSPWKASVNLRIRFTVATNYTDVDDGWYIDDLSVAEHLGGTVPMPFFDDFESGAGNWLAASWTPSPDTPHSGSWSMQSTPQGTLRDSTEHVMELAGDLDLSSSVDPQLTFWIRGAIGYRGGFQAQYSLNGGVNWSNLPGAALGERNIPDWTRYQISLATYNQSGVRIRFRTSQSSSASGTNIYLDDVSIEDMPDAVTLNALTPHLKSVDLSWTESALGDFVRYELYRSTTADVTTANDLVASFGTTAETSYTDTGLSIGATYYYRVFVINSRNVATPSNERFTTTVPLPMPLVDPMENLDNWDTDGAWGPDGITPHGGAFSIADSPGDNYPNSSTTYILTAVNLTGSSWPVLRFWDRYAFQPGYDWGLLEVSTNGSTWTRVYVVTSSRTAWAEQSVDLSPWKASDNLRIRFTVATNYTDVDDGWYIDDLSVAEHLGGTVPMPFFDDFESGAGNWLAASWTPSPDTPHSGSWSMQSTPQGTLRDSTEHVMELAGDLDLSSSVDPQLTFWIRGAIGYRGGFQAQYSLNGGVNWSNLPGAALGERNIPDWTRYQISLATYNQSGVRIRFRTSQSSSASGTNIYLDDVSIEDMPDAVTLNALTPHLKSVDLSWTESALGDFVRYELYRSTTADVTTANDLVASFGTTAETSYTDTGLSIGATYYYRVFVINSRNVATPSNERFTTTVPLPMPLVDPMENLDNWDTDGAWGPDGITPHGGAFSIADSPGDNYPNSSTTYILTAVNLTGSSWPVLRFWDRYAFQPGYDWGLLEVSTNGSTWTRVYVVTSSRTAWAEQSVDLSPWKASDNLRIRFTVATNYTDVDDGWYIDDLSVAEHLGGTVPMPFFDDFESGAGNWLAASWTPSPDTPHSGSWSMQSTPQGTLRDSTEHVMELAGDLDLSSSVDPQLTFWIRGAIGYRGGFQAQYSLNGGVNWSNLPGAALGERNIPDWTRYQISLATYNQSGVRIRFRTNQSSSASGTNIYLDDVSIEDMPDAVTLATPDQITISTMRLQWNDLNDPDFASYALYRSETSTVDTTSELITTITDQTTTEFVDTGLQARKHYYYRLYFVDTTHTYSPSNSTSAMTLGAPLPFNDDFETDTGVWTFTGNWGPVVAAGVGGSTSLGDSPGDLTQNLDAYAVTGIDLSSVSWPIMSFNERYDFAGHWGRVEISINGGANWAILEGATSDQTTWIHRRFDLSPWRGQQQVWVRFFVDANGGVPADGWHIDDLFIGENPLLGSGGFPFFDGLESGDGAWLNGPWSLSGDNPYSGSASILDTLNSRLGNSDLVLTYGDVIDLSASTDPLLTIQVRGNLPDNNWFRTEVSTDQGLTWQNLPDLYLPDNWSSVDWLRLQTPLSGYLVSDLRLRFRVYGNYGGDSNIFLDNISIGEQTPGAPTLNAPAQGASEPTVRPVLEVDNAIDFQSDPMTYEYQVFDDSGLTSVVAQVPAVAGGIDTTSWTIDVDLLPDTQYWWRCRATDDSAHTGGWMATATFFVQLTDHPPTVPVLLAPADGGELPDLNGRLTWLESTDPDADNGDYVASYRVQVDDDPAFASPEIDAPGITNLTEASGALSVSLGELPGSGGLVTETLYHWRVNAKDSHGVASDWSAGPARFVFGTDNTAPTCAILSPVNDQTVTGTPIPITGSAADNLSGIDTVEVSTDGGATWLQAVGRDSWSHQWWPALSGDYELSCRANDNAGNQGAASTPITVHAELDRTMVFTEAAATIDEDAGVLNLTVTLSGARATEINADLVVSGTAQPGVDFENLPSQVRFFPGQTVVVFPITVIDDAVYEGNETIAIELANPNIPDVTFGAFGATTVTIRDDEFDPTAVIFVDGFETGNASGWDSSSP